MSQAAPGLDVTFVLYCTPPRKTKIKSKQKQLQNTPTIKASLLPLRVLNGILTVLFLLRPQPSQNGFQKGKFVNLE